MWYTLIMALQCLWTGCERYICIIYTPNLGSGIAVPEGSRAALEGEHRGSTREYRESTEGSKGVQQASKGGRSKRGEVLISQKSLI